MSVPPPVGKHRQPNPPPGWPWPPATDGGKSTAWVRVDKKLAIWVAAIVVGVIVGAVTPGLAGHVIALVVWAVAAAACVRPARSVDASGAWKWARVGVVCFTAFAIVAGVYAVKSVVSPSGWYANGYNYAVNSYNAGDSPAYAYGSIGEKDEYLACRYVYINDVPRSGEGTDAAGVSYNAPSVTAPESAAEAWVNGCVAGEVHVGE